MERVNVEEKVLAYETFLNERLKNDLKQLLDLRDKVNEEISEYIQLKGTIEKLQVCDVKENLKTQMDIGCNFYVTAVVPDPTRIFVKVGFGFFVEFTFSEALTFIDKKLSFLNQVVEQYTKDASTVKAKIKIVLEGLRELQNLNVSETPRPSRDILL